MMIHDHPVAAPSLPTERSRSHPTTMPPFPYPRHGLLLLLALAVPGLVSAQGIGAAPTTAQCEAWATALGEGGEAAMDALRFGAISRCPDQAPAALERAILSARTVTDTSFLSGLAGQASAVRDPAVF